MSVIHGFSQPPKPKPRPTPEPVGDELPFPSNPLFYAYEYTDFRKIMQNVPEHRRARMIQQLKNRGVR